MQHCEIELLEKLEIIRAQLIKLSEENNHCFTISELLQKSQELDLLITEYYRLHK